MNMKTLYTLCHYIVFVGIFLTFVGALGQYYFGNKINIQKDKEFEDLAEETKKTKFKIEEESRKKTPSGEYEYQIKLKPIGENVIPIFTIITETKNGAIIKEFKIEGRTVPRVYLDEVSNDKTIQRKTFRTMYPGEVTIQIVTDKNPGVMKISIEPLLHE